MRSPLPDLGDSTARVLDALAAASEEEVTARAAAGDWSAWEIAYHLFDIERWYVAKLCEAVAGSRAEALTRFVAGWRALRRETEELVAALPPDRLDRPGILSGVPAWTPRTLVEAIAAHDREHAAQALAARARGIPH